MEKEIIAANIEHRDMPEEELRKRLTIGIRGVVAKHLESLGWTPPAGIFAISTKKFSLSNGRNSSVFAFFDRDASDNLVLKAIDNFSSHNNFSDCLMTIEQGDAEEVILAELNKFSSKVDSIIMLLTKG